jgi:hypothetical protein
VSLLALVYEVLVRKKEMEASRGVPLKTHMQQSNVASAPPEMLRQKNVASYNEQ